MVRDEELILKEKKRPDPKLQEPYYLGLINRQRRDFDPPYIPPPPPRECYYLEFSSPYLRKPEKYFNENKKIVKGWSVRSVPVSDRLDDLLLYIANLKHFWRKMKQMKMLKRLMKMNSAQLKERAVLQRRILLKHGYTLTTLLIHSGVYIRTC